MSDAQDSALFAGNVKSPKWRAQNGEGRSENFIRTIKQINK
jgi:hypothetical protein